MNFIKSIFLAIVITVCLTYIFDVNNLALTDAKFTMNGEALHPLMAFGAFSLFALFATCLAIAVLFSLFGGFLVISLFVIACITFLSIKVFWPIMLIALALWVFSRPKKTHQHV